MPNPNTALVAVVLDRSGSMSTLVESTVAGLNEFFRTQRETGIQTFLTLVQFDNVYEVVRDFVDLATVPDLTQKDFVPRGMTALLDAIGRTIVDVGNKLEAMPESTRPGKVVFVIQTDGFENSSHEFTHGRIADMISHQQQKYQWQFVFLGANQDAIATGAMLGISGGHSLTYNATTYSTGQAFGAIGANVASYIRSVGGHTPLDSFSEEVRKAVVADETVVSVDTNIPVVVTTTDKT